MMPVVSLVHDRYPIAQSVLNQSFYGLGKVRHYLFDENPGVHSDFVVTFGHIPWSVRPWWDSIPTHRKIAVLPENPLIFFPDRTYLEQHGLVISPAVPLGSDRVTTRWVFSHGGVPWFYGHEYSTRHGTSHVNLSKRDTPCLEYHVERPPPVKSKLLSMVTSTKRGLEGHRFRLALRDALRLKFGDQEFQTFGFGGEHPVSAKRDAIDPFQFTVVVENSFIDNYMTEKICDAYLGYCQPIYFGASNIQKFFDAQILNGPTHDIDEGVAFVLASIDRDISKVDLVANRNNVMLRNNLLYHLSYILDNL